MYRQQPTDPYYILDITSQLSCASSSPVLLLEYRYGGLGIRATEEWNKDNSMTLTSEGKNRKEADGSTARWCLTQGSLGNDYGGLVMMSYPSNYNYPEPLRVWPENMNGRGDVFLNFSPTKNKDWLLEPGKTYLLKYRFLIFDNKLSKNDAEEVWQSFANPPSLKIQK
ncbi:PmoA family protein [Niabella ginsengisoli]|uniref:PmoA family protein n=1 Tax=Niabella ginsengisoli TaxID=522298 RepID=A0ABS9SI92_9BACT|nr:PmoA family protein [Niabella ginsengisoli]